MIMVLSTTSISLALIKYKFRKSFLFFLSKVFFISIKQYYLTLATTSKYIYNLQGTIGTQSCMLNSSTLKDLKRFKLELIHRSTRDHSCAAAFPGVKG